MSRILGLTGSIGMGKSTAAAMIRAMRVPVFDADATVHALQGPGGALVAAIEALHPGVTGAHGVDRQKLGAAVLGNRAALRRLERLIHPAVARRRAAFLRRHRACPLVVLDIPLLFEARLARTVDAILVVSAPAGLQRRRVLARPGMTAARLARIRALQWPDAAKRRAADWIVPSLPPPARMARLLRRIVACERGRAGR